MDHGMMAAKKFEEEGKPVAEASEIFKSVPLPWPCNAEDIEEAAAVASSSSWIWSGAAEIEGHSGAHGCLLSYRHDTLVQCSYITFIQRQKLQQTFVFCVFGGMDGVCRAGVERG